MMNVRRALGVGIVGVMGMMTVLGESAPALADSAATIGSGPVITSIVPTSTSYAGGPLSFDVSVYVDGNVDAKDVQIAFFAPGTGLFSKTVDIKAKTTTHVIFTDAAGLNQLCVAKDYTFEKMGGRKQTMRARVTPTCTFATKIVDPFNLMTPNAAEYQQKDTLSAACAIDGAMTCASPLKVKSLLVNHANKDGKNLHIELLAAQGLKIVESSAFNVDKGGHRTVTFAADRAVGGKIDVKVVDPGNSLGGKLVNQGIAITVTPACTLATAVTTMP